MCDNITELNGSRRAYRAGIASTFRRVKNVLSLRMFNTVLIGYCDDHPVTKSPKMWCCDYFSNVPNVPLVSTLELLPCDNYRPVTIFWPFPEEVTTSDRHCIALWSLAQSG